MPAYYSWEPRGVARSGGPSGGDAAAGGGSFTDVPVTPSGSGSLTVDWNLPTTNADGSALSPTPTYQRIRVALSSGFFDGYPFAYYIADFTSTSKTITSLVAATTYYMVHETYANGQWSESSPEFSEAAA